MVALSDICHNWKMLAQSLEMSINTEEIACKHEDSRQCMENLLEYWLKNDRDASWMKLVMATEKMGMPNVAMKIRTTYCCSGSTCTLCVLMQWTYIYCRIF